MTRSFVSRLLELDLRLTTAIAIREDDRLYGKQVGLAICEAASVLGVTPYNLRSAMLQMFDTTFDNRGDDACAWKEGL